MKKLFVFGLAALLTAPLVAQHQSDPDKKVAGGGTLPTGWKARIDDSAPIAGVKVMPMGSGIHFMTGPAGIYYKPADKAAGTYTATATFTQMEPAAHPEAYGIIIGGSGLEGAAQKYTYFVIRQDGKYLVKRRAGADTPTVIDWTDNAAIKKADASGKMTNTLAIDVGKDKVRFLVNGAEVTATEPGKVDTDGVAGLRINHNLNVHVEGFGVKTR
jgi:hypothetical protein